MMNSLQYNHPFVFFILLFLIPIFITISFIFAVYVILKFLGKIFDNIKCSKLKKIIERNPYLGKRDEDNNFIYTQGKSSLKYKIISSSNNGAKNRIKLISEKRKLWFYEKWFSRFFKNINNFLIYRQWIYFLNPKIFFILLPIALIFYFLVFEPQQHKNSRFRRIISFALRVDPKNVEIEPDGWVKILGIRRTAVDSQFEPVEINVNLFDWFTFQENACNITRWRGEGYGSVNYPLEYDEDGNIWLNKEGKWISGAVDKNTINWKEPQGSGIRAGKVVGHDLNVKDKLALPDK